MTKEELDRWERVLLGEGPVAREDRKTLFELLKTIPLESPDETHPVSDRPA